MAQLKESTFDKLFVSDGVSLPSDSETNTCLRSLMGDSALDSAPGFFAAKTLLDRQIGLEEAEMERVVFYFAEAIKASADPSLQWLGLTGNHWLVGGSEWTPGELGLQLLEVKDGSFAPLYPLLEDERPLAFEGSEEATMADMHVLRVKDAAATILARKSGVELDWSPLPGERDKAIRELR